MKDLDLYADLFDNDLEGEDAVHNPKDITDYVNRLLYKNSALQTELEALQARNSRLEVERNQLLAAKDQISDNFVRLGLACRQEIAKLKQRVLWLCKRVKVKEPKFSSVANRTAPQSCEMNLEKPVMYSTLLAYLHTNQSPSVNCEAVTTISCSDPIPKVAGGPSVTSSMSLQSSPAPMSTFKPLEPSVERRKVSRSCSSCSSSSGTSRSSSSSSSTSSSASSHLSSSSHAPVASSTSGARPDSSPSSTTATDGPQRNQPSTSDALPLDNTSFNPFSSKPTPTSPFTKRKQVALNDRKGRYNRDCTNNRRISQNDPSPRASQHRLLDDRSKPIPPFTYDRSKNQTRHCIQLDASPQKTGHISATSHNRSKSSASKIASYDEWEANRVTRSRCIRHPPSRDRSYVDENSKHLPHHPSDGRFTSMDEIRDGQHSNKETCVRYRSPESRQPSKSTVRSESSANLSQEKLATNPCKQQKLYKNEDSGLGLSTGDRICRQLLSLVQHSVCQAREHHATRRARQPPLNVTVGSNAAVQMTDPQDSLPGGQEASTGRRRRTPRSRDSTSPTVYTKRLRRRREPQSTAATGLSSPAPTKETLAASDTTCAEEPSQARIVSSSTSPPGLVTAAGLTAVAATSTGKRKETTDDEVVTILVDQSSASFNSLTDTLSNTVPLESNSSPPGECVPLDRSVALSSTASSAPLTSGELVETLEPTNHGDPNRSPPQTYSKDEEANDSEPASEEMDDRLELAAQPEEGDDHWSSWDEVLQPVGDQSQMTDDLGQGSEHADDHRAPSVSDPDKATADNEHKEEGEIADDDYEDDARDELAERPTDRRGKRSWSDDSEQDEMSENGAGGGGVSSPHWLADKRYRRHAADYSGVRPESRPEENRSSSSTHRGENTGEHRSRRRTSKSRVPTETYARPTWRGVENTSSRTVNNDDRQSRAKPRSPLSPASPRDSHGLSFSGSPAPKPSQQQQRDIYSKTSDHRDSSASSWYDRRRPRRTRTTPTDGDEPDSAGPSRLPAHHGEARRRYGFSPSECPTTDGGCQRQFRPRQNARRWSPALAGKAARFPQHRREPQKTRTTSGRASRSPSDQRLGGLQYAGGKPPGRGKSWGNREDRRQAVRRPTTGGYYSPSATSQPPPPPHRVPCSSSSAGGVYRHSAGLSQRRRPLPARVGGNRFHRRF